MKIVNKTDFTKTLNLPKQVIAIKGNQVKKEDYILDKIQDIKKYQFVLNKNIKSEGKKYKIIEMPTDIENRLSSTIILNKILKDFVVKEEMLEGNYLNHNLIFTNVEHMEQIDSLPNSKNNLQELLKSRQQKRKELANIFKGQTYEINRLGTTINYDKYTTTTIKTDFEIEMIKKFFEMYNANRLAKEVRSVHWCTKCGTSKHRKDLKFKKQVLNNYYVLYRIEDDKGKLAKYNNLKEIYFVASTFRPWLMVASENIAISDELEYSLVEITKEDKKIHYIIASEFVQDVMQKEFYSKYDIKQTFKASDLSEILCMNPLDYRRRVKIIITKKDRVSYSKDDSTGIRIVSSGHTYLDYLILNETNKDALKSVVDEIGKTNGMSLVFQNMYYKEVNEKIIEYLKNSNFIYSVQKLKISLPMCDKCGEETIFRVINDWYTVKEKEDIITEEMKNKLASKMSANIKYKKEELLDGISKVNNAREALISDKNIMGTPIPVFYCADCGANIITDKTVEILSNMIKAKGSDAWYKQTPEEILQGQVACRKCGCTFFFKENATLNNFFKYICINLMQKEELEKERNTINLLIENKEEFIENLRALSFIPNFKDTIEKIDKILVHSNVKENLDVKEDNKLESVKDKKNKKQSLFSKRKNKKSNIKIENEITDIVNNYGTDILRLWAAIFASKERISLNKQMLININKKYKNIRRTFKFLLSNLYDFHPAKNYVKVEDRLDIDKYVYNELYSVTQKVKEAYNNLEFNNVYKLLTAFSEEVLCKFYFEAIKYKLYILNANDKKRRSIQSNIQDIILTLCSLWYPIIPFTIEEIWPYIYHKSQEEDRIIFSYKIDLKDISDREKEAILKWKKISQVKQKLDTKIKLARAKKFINKSSEAKIVLNTNSYTKKFVDDNYEDILESVYVSSIETNVTDEHDVKIEKEPGNECPRCRRHTNDIGKNLKYRYLCPICADILEEQTQK